MKGAATILYENIFAIWSRMYFIETMQYKNRIKNLLHNGMKLERCLFDVRQKYAVVSYSLMTIALMKTSICLNKQ